MEKKVLAQLAWSGVPNGFSRCEVWQLLLGYRPLTSGRRADALQRKRQEYSELRRSLYDASPAVAAAREAESRGEVSGDAVQHEGAVRDAEAGLLKQIRKDLPRTRIKGSCAGLVEDPRIQGLMERVLFVWAVRQPASGYVQGLNDVLLPLVLVSLADQGGPGMALDIAFLNQLGEEKLAEVEADCYWCVTKILSEIFDHYTHGQPGIQRMVQMLKDIIQRIDAPLARHLEAQGIDLLHTAFRWITCLMVRELPVACCIRLWDTLISESAQAACLGAGQRPVGGGSAVAVSSTKSLGGSGQGAGGIAVVGSAGFEVLLVYFCACFTAYFSSCLQQMDFEAITLFMQKMPTDNFTEGDVEVLLSEAYVLKSLFEQAPRHLSGTPG